ncbi:E2 ubiquitin-protein ligase peroxin 4 [Dispira simplex]|nr:E2 ubiquitin-protein ligase peroxin 4 [Dispira simplex]
MTTTALRRLMKELQDLRKPDALDKDNLLTLAPVADDSLFAWEAVLHGPPGTGYHDGLFKVDIDIPETYPMQPPVCRFVTPICHPNVHFGSGEICLDILKTAWSPAWTLTSVCRAIHHLLSYPEPTSPLNCDAAALLRIGDQVAYESLTRMYTQLFAQRRCS